MRHTRVAIAVVFFADGLLIGSWASRIPAVKLHAQLTDTKLGLALFAAALGALVAMPLAGWLSGIVGSRRVTVVALSLGSVALFGATLAGGLAGLAVALFVFGAGFGAINVSANAQGLALERLYGRSILSSFHAAFSGGALAGAALGALAAAAGIGQQAHLGTVAIVVGAAVVAFTPRLPSLRSGRFRPDADPRPSAASTSRHRGGGVLHAVCGGRRGRLERRLLVELARCDGRGGRTRLHRVLAGDGREPAGRRSPQRPLRARDARSRGRGARCGWARAGTRERLDRSRARRLRGNGCRARSRRSGAVPRGGFETRCRRRHRCGCRLDDRLAWFPRRSTHHRVRCGSGRRAGRALDRRSRSGRTRSSRTERR